MRNNPEILAPVGTEGSLEAAVYAGADAVYFGAGACNARRNAGQFTGERLIEAVRFCHAHGVGVHVTVNTLVRDEERNAVADTIAEIAEAGVDAAIVQDLCVMRLIKEICPSLPMHGSTQMAIHNAAGVKELTDLGFSRVVLARELSIDEIRKIKEETSVELEAFVHGALCMSASGMCYLSAMLGERSGNRGLCAQPCRLPFTCNGSNYALSLKDMSHIAYYDAYRGIGIDSLKIEGRLKSPEYVAATVDALRRVRDGEPYSEEMLKSVFSRSGFTDGYYRGQRNHTMFGVRTEADAKRSQKASSDVRGLFRGPKPRVPVSMRIELIENRPAALTVSDGTHEVRVAGDVPEIAVSRPLSEESVQKSVAKTGGTPFYLEALNCALDPGLMLSASSLNALRRTALDALYAKRAEPPKREIKPPSFETQASPRRATPVFCVRYASAEQWCFDPRIAYYSLPADELIKHPERIAKNAAAEVPALVYPNEEAAIAATLSELKKQGLTFAVAENIGALRLIREAGLVPIGGYGLNVTNSDAIAQYARRGVSVQFVSFELSAPKIRDLVSEIPLGMIVSGRLPLMQLRSCPARTDRGCGSCDGRPTVGDRKGAAFPLVCHGRRYSTLLNSVPLYVADRQLPPIDAYAVYLTNETPKEAGALIRSSLDRAPYTEPHTTGLAFRNLL